MDGINKSKLPRYSFNVLEHHIFLRHNKMNQNLKNYVDILLFWFEILFLKSFSDASSSILIYQNEKTTNFCANRIQDFLFNNYLTWSDVTPWQEKKNKNICKLIWEWAMNISRTSKRKSRVSDYFLIWNPKIF